MKPVNKPAIVAGRFCKEYATKVAKILGVPLLKRKVEPFSDEEIDIDFTETVAGLDVFIIQAYPTGTVHGAIIENMLLADALIRARAHSVTLVQMYFPYSRKDRKEYDSKTQRPKRCPISARVIAEMFTGINIKRTVTFNLHSPQIAGFFPNSSPCEDISLFKLFAAYLKKEKLVDTNTIFVGPDIGSAKSVDIASSSMLLDFALIYKKRGEKGMVSMDQLGIIGDVVGKNVILYDDIIDTGGTVLTAAAKLKKAGAKRIYLMAVHPVLSKNAIARLSASDSPFDKIVVTDTIPHPELQGNKKFVVLSTVAMTADIIASLFNDKTLEKVVRHRTKLETKKK